ncbi:MAG: hypothetical protein ACRDMA_04425 [Solirubrobacterales bacterium]
MRSRGRVGAALAALCLGVALSGCGDDDGPDPADPAMLLDHIPPGASELRFADLAAMRSQLGLPEDADVADFPRGEHPADDGQRRLAMTAGALLTYLGLGVKRGLRRAIDHGAITAAASNVTTGAPGISVIRTSQPFDEIAATLEHEGYTRAGNVVRSRKYRGAPKSSRGSIETYGSGARIKPALPDQDFLRRFNYPVVADAGDGVVVLGFERRTVENAVTGSAGSGDPVRALLEDVEGVARGSAMIVGNCVRALAVGESFDPHVTELRIDIDGEASADRFRLPELRERPHLEYGEPGVGGETLTAEIVGGRDPDLPGVVIARDLSVLALDPDRIYDC